MSWPKRRAVPDLQQTSDNLFLSFYITFNQRFQCLAAVVQFATFVFPWKCGGTERLLSCGGDIVKLHSATESGFLWYFSFFCFFIELGTPVWVTGVLYVVVQVPPHLECVKAAENKE